MAEPAYGKVYPFEGDQQAGDAEWRHMQAAMGDGIVNDTTGDSFGIASKSGSDRSFVVTLGECRIQGINFEPVDDTITLTPSAPSVGLKRADRVIAKFDLGAKTVTVELDSSGSAVSGTPSPPALVRNRVDDWTLPLWIVSGSTGPATSLTFSDERMWAPGSPLAVTTAAVLSELTDLPIGTCVYAMDTKHEYRRTRVGLAVVWWDLDLPNWQNIALPSDKIASSGSEPQYAKVRGVVYMRGTAGRAATSEGGVFKSGGGTGGVYSMGSVPPGFIPGRVVTWSADRASNATAIAVTMIVRETGLITARVQGDTTAIAYGGGAYVAEL